jgi:hypothetical protein
MIVVRIQGEQQILGTPSQIKAPARRQPGMNIIRKNEDKEETCSALDSVFSSDPWMFPVFRRKRNPSSPSFSEGIGAHQRGEC